MRHNEVLIAFNLRWFVQIEKRIRDFTSERTTQTDRFVDFPQEH
jgi:hypothetical protein